MNEHDDDDDAAIEDEHDPLDDLSPDELDQLIEENRDELEALEPDDQGEDPEDPEDVDEPSPRRGRLPDPLAELPPELDDERDDFETIADDNAWDRALQFAAALDIDPGKRPPGRVEAIEIYFEGQKWCEPESPVTRKWCAQQLLKHGVDPVGTYFFRMKGRAPSGRRVWMGQQSFHVKTRDLVEWGLNKRSLPKLGEPTLTGLPGNGSGVGDAEAILNLADRIADRNRPDPGPAPAIAGPATFDINTMTVGQVKALGDAMRDLGYLPQAGAVAPAPAPEPEKPKSLVAQVTEIITGLNTLAGMGDQPGIVMLRKLATDYIESKATGGAGEGGVAAQIIDEAGKITNRVVDAIERGRDSDERQDEQRMVVMPGVKTN